MCDVTVSYVTGFFPTAVPIWLLVGSTTLHVRHATMIYSNKTALCVLYSAVCIHHKSAGICTYRYTCIALCFSYTAILHHKSVRLYYPKTKLSIVVFKLQVFFCKRATYYRVLFICMYALGSVQGGKDS